MAWLQAPLPGAHPWAPGPSLLLRRSCVPRAPCPRSRLEADSVAQAHGFHTPVSQRLPVLGPSGSSVRRAPSTAGVSVGTVGCVGDSWGGLTGSGRGAGSLQAPANHPDPGFSKSSTPLSKAPCRAPGCRDRKSPASSVAAVTHVSRSSWCPLWAAPSLPLIQWAMLESKNQEPGVEASNCHPRPLGGQGWRIGSLTAWAMW